VQKKKKRIGKLKMYQLPYLNYQNVKPTFPFTFKTSKGDQI